MKTFRLWLMQDEQIPRFQRLRWEMVDVTIVQTNFHRFWPGKLGVPHHKLQPFGHIKHALGEAVTRVQEFPFTLPYFPQIN